MATLSLSTQKPTFHLRHHRRCFRHRAAFLGTPRGSLLRPIVAVTRIPSAPPTAPPGELYQPFRPPTSPLPAKYRSLGTEERLDILRNRLGLWHEYAPLISSLSRDGFTPPSIEEITGISGVEQNLLVVASQVRESLLADSFPPEILAFFDSGADLLYELRLLNASQRSAAAYHLVERRLDSKAARELARSIKDFPRRRGEVGWGCFSGESPRDCLAFTYFRLSREAVADSDGLAVLEKALEVAETERARSRILEEVEKRRKGETEEDEEQKVALAAVPVVRLRYGEVADASTVVLLPVCKAEEGSSVLDAVPESCKSGGEMGVITAEKGWRSWVVLPGWGLAAAVAQAGGVAVEFADGTSLPWRNQRWQKEEAVIVVADRKAKKVEQDGFYLVQGEAKLGLIVERGRKLLESGRTEALGAVVMVVRPPREENEDELRDEDWD